MSKSKRTPASMPKTDETAQAPDRLVELVESATSQKGHKSAVKGLVREAFADEEGILSYKQRMCLTAKEMGLAETDLEQLGAQFNNVVRKYVPKAPTDKIHQLVQAVPSLLEHIVEDEEAKVAEAVLGGLFDTFAAEEEPTDLLSLGQQLIQAALDREEHNQVREALSLVVAMLRLKHPVTDYRDHPQIFHTFFSGDNWVFDEQVLTKALIWKYVAANVSLWYMHEDLPIEKEAVAPAERHFSSIYSRRTQNLPKAERDQLGKKLGILDAVHRNTGIEINSERQQTYPFNLLVNDPDGLYTRLTKFLARDQIVTPSDFSERYAIVTVPTCQPYIVKYTNQQAHQGNVAAEIRHIMLGTEIAITAPAEIQSFINSISPVFPSLEDDPDSREQAFDELELNRKERQSKFKNSSQRALPSKRVLSVTLEQGFDEELDAINIKHVEFERKNARATQVRVFVGQSYVVLNLEDLRLVHSESGRAVFREPVRANFVNARWWENKVLKVLESYAFAKVEEEHSTRVSKNGEIINRCGHRRELPPYHQPSERQFELAVAEQGWDLVNENEKRDGSAERPFITYVSEVVNNENAQDVPPLNWTARAPH